MRRSQQFRPGAMLSLEGRIALSSFAHAATSEHAHVASTTPAPSILSIFPREAPILAAGSPVYERWITTFYDGLSQVDYKTFVFNNQTVTITENIVLPGTAGTETVVDHYTAIQGGVLYQNTVTEPNGQTEAETRTDTFQGPGRILHRGSFERPDGVAVAFTGITINQGARIVINNSFDESSGISFNTHEVDLNQSTWQASSTVTTKWRDGSLQIDKAAASGVQLSSLPS
jgi:hypothetical protein